MVSGGWICRQRVAKVYEPSVTFGVGVTQRLSYRQVVGMVAFA